MFKRKKETFYYAGHEVPALTPMDRYKCLDDATRGVLRKASKRIAFLMVVFFLCFSAIIGRLFYLTVLSYQSRSFTPSVLKTDLNIIRHNVLDRNGMILATSVPTKDLSINPKMVKSKDKETVAENLAKVLPGVSKEDVLNKINMGGSFRYIKRNITPLEQKDINWLGYYFLMETDGEKRVYPQGSLFSHLLGSVDIDNKGTAGIEKAYEPILAERNLMLSLDISVQDIVHRTLAQNIQKFKASGGTSIVMDVHTGEVLASVSLPDYNPNLALDADEDARFNKATLGAYEFGSVFKLFNTAMALDAGVIKPYDVFDATKPMKIGKKTFEDYRGQNRPLMVPEILIHSSNIGSIRIALKAGWQKQKEFLGRFGFYNPLPIKLPERTRTQYPRAKKWAEITSANVSFGYGISVSPLHLISAVSALVNGGYYRVPTFIKGGNKGRAEYQVLSKKVSDQMRHMMWGVINWNLKESDPIRAYAVGGKTGSANLLKNGKYVQGSLRTTFVCAFPMNDPKYAVLVVLENPQRIKETFNFNTAGWNAKPTGLQIVSEIAPYLGVPAQEEWEQPSYMKRAIETSLNAKKR
ncbi:MAG: penicillin-binding protein 2 [Alphaproteobacteria bacterium]|nr:penicillin-binding protein 2 [Alphaproteobacteria bacterium]